MGSQQYYQDLENHFFPAFEKATVGFAKIGIAGEWLRVNQRLCNITGYSEAELLQMTFQEMTHPDDLSEDMHNVRKILRKETDFNLLEKRYIRKDGSIVWVHLTATLIRDEMDTPLYFMAVIEDITPRKLVEEALQKSEERFQLVIKASNDGIWDWDPATDQIYWNECMYEFFESQPGGFEPTMEALMERIHPEDQAKAWEAIRAAFERNEKYDHIMRLKHNEGHYRYFHSRGELIRNEQGTPTRMAGILSDITLQKDAEEELRQSLERERVILKIIELVNQSFDLQYILENAAKEICTFFKANRCLVIRYDRGEENYLLQLSGQHRSHEWVCHILDQDIPFKVPENIACESPLNHSILSAPPLQMEHLSPRLRKYLSNSILMSGVYLQKVKNLMSDCPSCAREHLDVVEHYLERHGIRSSLTVEIQHQGIVYGLIITNQCDEARVWKSEDAAFLEKLAMHLGIILHQALLFQGLSETVKAH